MSEPVISANDARLSGFAQALIKAGHLDLNIPCPEVGCSGFLRRRREAMGKLICPRHGLVLILEQRRDPWRTSWNFPAPPPASR